MRDWLIDALLARSPRERLLLGALLVVVLPLALGLGGLVPLQERREAAETARAEALALQGWVRARGIEAAQLQRAETAAPAAPIGTGEIEQGLIAAGLRDAVSELGTRADGAVDLRFDEVDFERLARWLSGVHPGWGYDLESYRFEAIDRPGYVAVGISLRPHQN